MDQTSKNRLILNQKIFIKKAGFYTLGKASAFMVSVPPALYFCPAGREKEAPEVLQRRQLPVQWQGQNREKPVLLCCFLCARR
ncbi:MAG: hypothetical protein A2031_08170 [Deltaproteobacteria bacterium RBG_19FT_COMBO_43_11]|nr:MAG: hypothetical protein A2031_08170 [Deltaproteobacteria bacterium RBG_19FT_COMBO_43_11]